MLMSADFQPSFQDEGSCRQLWRVRYIINNNKKFEAQASRSFVAKNDSPESQKGSLGQSNGIVVNGVV